MRRIGDAIDDHPGSVVDVVEIDPVIVVFPCSRNTGYTDYFDGSYMTETMIVKELLPEVDRRFRTIADGSARAVKIGQIADLAV